VPTKLEGWWATIHRITGPVFVLTPIPSALDRDVRAAPHFTSSPEDITAVLARAREARTAATCGRQAVPRRSGNICRRFIDEMHLRFSPVLLGSGRTSVGGSTCSSSATASASTFRCRGHARRSHQAGVTHSLTLYFHPLSSFCHSADRCCTRTTRRSAKARQLQDEGERTAFRKMCRSGNFRCWRDEARDWTVNESSIIIEYLDQHWSTRLIPTIRSSRARCVFADRFFDLYVHLAVAEGVGDRLRPEARRTLMASRMRARPCRPGSAWSTTRCFQTWAAGEDLRMAAARRRLAILRDKVMPFGHASPRMRISIGGCNGLLCACAQRGRAIF